MSSKCPLNNFSMFPISSHDSLTVAWHIKRQWGAVLTAALGHELGLSANSPGKQRSKFSNSNSSASVLKLRHAEANAHKHRSKPGHPGQPRVTGMVSAPVAHIP